MKTAGDPYTDNIKRIASRDCITWEAVALVRALSDAEFDCGEWRSSDDNGETFQQVMRRASKATRALHAYIRELERRPEP